MNIRRKPVIFTCLSMCAACATLIDGAAAQTTGLAGKFVMPGIINLHGLVGNTVDLAQDPRNFTGENAERQLRIYASSGVTSVGSMGSEPAAHHGHTRQAARRRPPHYHANLYGPPRLHRARRLSHYRPGEAGRAL